VRSLLLRLLVVAAALTALGAAALADEPPRVPVWLVAPTLPPAPRPPTYFERHYARVEHDMLFFDRGYTLELMRERDGLSLYGPTPGTNVSTALGIGLFSGVVVSAAHTPPFLRFAYDRALHVGPAIFEGGGMGAGFGGRL
jgi:hypothetical protein